MKTIAVFHPSSELYGADRILVNALKALPEHVNKRIYLKSNGPLVDLIESNVKHVSISINPNMPIIYRQIFTPKGLFQFVKDWFQFVRFLKAEQKKYRFKSAYLNTLSTVFILMIIKGLKVPSFVHVHEIIDRPKLIGFVTTWLCKLFASRIICVSEAVLKGLKRYAFGLAQKTEVLHNGIDPIMVSDKSITPRLNFYLFGRIMPKKGQWLLIEALGHLNTDVLSKCRFVLMGGVLKGHEDLLMDLEAKIAAAGLCQYVEIKGFAKNISGPMAAADVCLVPSVMKDPFPTTVLEAMSAGRPVIATNHGGAKEAIVHGKTGYLIDANDAQSLAMYIEKLANDRHLIEDLGRNARFHYKARFTIQHFNQNWLDFNEKYAFI